MQEYGKDVHCPHCYSTYNEELLRQATEKTDKGIYVGDTIVKPIWFTDDQAIVSSNEHGVQEIMNAL